MKVGVRIMPLNEVLDTQGRAVEKLFEQNGKKVESVRIGRYVELELTTNSKDEAIQQAKDLAQFVLCNSLIEKFEIELI